MLCVVSLCFLNHFELGRCLTVAEPDFDLGVGGGGGKGRFLDLPNPGIFSFFCFFLTRSKSDASASTSSPSLRSVTPFQAPRDSSEESQEHVCCSLSIFFWFGGGEGISISTAFLVHDKDATENKILANIQSSWPHTLSVINTQCVWYWSGNTMDFSPAYGSH